MKCLIAQLPVPIHIRTWLDNPTNMNKLWDMAKRIINDLPPPRNVGDLARVLDRLFAIIRLRLQLIMELYRGKANPTIYRGLAAMGSQPREGRVNHSRDSALRSDRLRS